MDVDGGKRNSTRIRREEILAATLDCYVESGPGGTFITEVCSRADVSVGTLYHYFGSKEQLLATLQLATLNAYQASVRSVLEADPPAYQGVLDTVDARLHWLDSHPKEATFLLQQPSVDPRSESVPQEVMAENDGFQAVLRSWLARRYAAKELRELPFGMVMAFLVGPVHYWMRSVLRADRLDDDLDLAIAELGEGVWEALRYR
jgi:AcrR family transcriptional regulator